jgi:hypothetical protein
MAKNNKAVKFEGQDDEQGIKDVRATTTELTPEQVEEQAQREKDLAQQRAEHQAKEDELNGTTPGGPDSEDEDGDEGEGDGEDEPVLTGDAADEGVKTALPEEKMTRAQKVDHAMEQLHTIRKHFGNRKEDDILKEGVHSVDLGIVMELSDRHARGKELHLSDGHIERLGILHKKLIK